MRNKPYAFLGRYLLAHGLVTQEHLDEAIRLQRESIALVGTIALNQGFLDNKQLNYLIKRQIEVDKQIGELALQEGFMTEGQLDTVLAIQARNHLLLGESLVRLGKIRRETLTEAIADFENEIITQERLVRENITHLPIAKQLLISLDVTLRFFCRLGYVVHIVGRCEAPPDYVEYLFCSEQNFRKRTPHYMGLGMPSVLVTSFGQGPGIRDRFDAPSPSAMENMSQLTFNLNYIVCKTMRKQGIRAKHGAAFIDASYQDGGHSVCVEMETVIGPMVLTYSDRPPAVESHLF